MLYKGLYIAHHDRIADLIVKDISTHSSPLVKMYKHSCVKPSMFHLCNSNPGTFSHLSANTPDAVVVNEESKEVFILETACTFDSSLEEALTTNPSYTPSQSWVTGAGYLSSYLRHTHRLVIRGLQQLGG